LKFQGQPQQFQGQPQQFQGQGQPPQQGRQPQHQQGKVLHKDNKDISKEAEHMKEHEAHIDTSNMSEQELQFHYFKMHDSDGNNKLDGLELVKSLIHWHDEANHDPKSGQPVPEQKIFLDEELKHMIDPILDSDDKNKDGFIDYPEFVAAQQAAASSAGAP
jgi:Ca2+-binding EF-hand superfamily protein